MAANFRSHKKLCPATFRVGFSLADNSENEYNPQRLIGVAHISDHLTSVRRTRGLGVTTRLCAEVQITNDTNPAAA